MNQTTMNEINNKMKNGRVFGLFHNDLDGYGCGKVASVFLNMADAHYVNYNEVNKEIESFCKKGYKNHDCLIVADLNLEMSNMEALNKLAIDGYPVMYFDHHFKSEAQFNFFKKGNIVYNFSKEICATKLMFNYFSSHEYEYNKIKLLIDKKNDEYDYKEVNTAKLSEIVDLIDSWDLYKWQNPNTFEVINDTARELNMYFKEFGRDRTLWKIDNYITGQFDKLFSNFDISNLKLLKRNLTMAIYDRNANLTTIQYPFDGEVYDIGITYADRDVSEIGNRLNIMNKNLSFIVIIDMIHNSVNFRTIFDSPNLAKIAANFGGGGHPKAAGCELNEKAFNAFVNRTLSRDQVDTLISFNNKNNAKNEEVVTSEAEGK